MEKLTVIDDMRLSSANDFLLQTKKDLDDVKKSFFRIGYRLNEAHRKLYYMQLGYEDIYELAEAEFGFRRTTTKNLMLLNRTYSTGYFSAPTMEIAPEFEKYSQTQLVEMLPLSPGERENVPETFTARDIRDYKKIMNFQFDQRAHGLPGTWEMRKDPARYVKEYRERMDAGENVTQKQQSSVSQLTKNKDKQLWDIPEGQLYLSEDDNVIEFAIPPADIKNGQSTDLVEKITALEFKDRLRSLKEAKGVSTKKLAIDLAVGERTVTYWLSGVTLPSCSVVVAIARYFNVTSDYLLGV